MPTIYVFSNKKDTGWLKIGQTNRTAEARIKEQIATSRNSDDIVMEYECEHSFSDNKIHKLLKDNGFHLESEWVHCDLATVKAAIVALQEGKPFQRQRIHNFPPRNEQQLAVEQTSAYFTKHASDKKSPKFLWNAKMRFGKTFTTYKLAQKMNWSKVLILTFKPAVMASWRDDLETHSDFDEWTFLNLKHFKGDEISSHHAKKIVCFGSLQDVLTYTKDGQIKEKNQEIHLQEWDCVVFDEFHFGAWRERTQDMLNDKSDAIDKDETDDESEERKGELLKLDENFDANNVPIKGKHFLYLSGTPFRALANGDFLEDQIYNWTYIDEQQAKASWSASSGDNPYKNLPQIKMYTYRLPDTLKEIAQGGEFDEFGLNEFFKATRKNGVASFKHHDKVIAWLGFISAQANIKENLTDKITKPMLPFQAINQGKVLNHVLWYLPSVASCFAMQNLLKDNLFFANYHVITVAGDIGGTGVDALSYLNNQMHGKDKTITLSCGKLTTGVTVKEWQAIFMLRDINSPESYFQSAFRVQTANENKHFCYIFDFAPNRALSQLTEYVCSLSIDDKKSPQDKLSDFIKFLPILAYDGLNMEELSAEGVYEFTNSITTASMLAKSWRSANLVNVENHILEAIIANSEAMAILEKFEVYRKLKDCKTSVREDITKVINLNKEINNLKTKEPMINSETQGSLFKEIQKERQTTRQRVRERLLLMAQRLPVFMYLSDYREQTLQDVIEKLEPLLFEDTTNITVDDFKVLDGLGVFNKRLMNDAVYKFRLYEEGSLRYLA